ncbi:M23 family metallopeptidase [Nakamurella sp. A5-74]|uniref:M23 family metallopeptidase n=1 Tax=Nakamurella sp. A5-74 TaxID=3158264 RepID=A0AAU8DLA4_9ACTN
MVFVHPSIRSAVQWPLLVVLVLGSGPAAGTGPAPTPVLPVSLQGTARDGPSGNGFVAPLAGAPVVLTPFRPPAERYGRGHRGVDLAATPGSRVRAAGAGTVVFAGPLAGRGVVSIEHASGLRTTYEPVDPSVSAGARVAAGQPIGTLSPGHPSCAPRGCLHWGARLGPQTYVDPMLLIGRIRIRLEPWSR